MPDQSKFLTTKLRALGRTLVLAELSRRLVVALAAAVLLLCALVLTDALLELDLQARKTLLTIAAALSGALLLRALITPITQRRDDEELALLTERHHPAFDSRLISAIQFARGKGSVIGHGALVPADQIVASMVADTESIASQTDLQSVVDWRRLGRALLGSIAIAAAAASAYFIFHSVTPTLLQRAFLADIPIPRETLLLSTTGDLKIGIGDRITITATAGGILPEQGTLRVGFASGRRLDYPLSRSGPAGTGDTYSADIEDVPESFTYQVRINDAHSADHQVTAYARPEVATLTATQTYPAYTGIEPSTHLPGDFYLFPGSRFTLQLAATKPLAEATLRLIGPGQEIPVDTADGTATFDVPTEGLTGFSITMRDTDGMEAREPSVYRAELLGDEPPKVRITLPARSDELVTKGARCLIAFEATDRFGIASVRLHFRINDAEPQSAELEIARTEDGKLPKSLKNQYDWDLKTIEPPLRESDVLEYWITAQDLQIATPGIGESDHLRLRVVSVGEKRQDLLSRASDYLGGVGATTEDQQRLNSDLGDMIRAKGE